MVFRRRVRDVQEMVCVVEDGCATRTDSLWALWKSSLSLCAMEIMGCAISVEKVDEEGLEFEGPTPSIEEHAAGMTMKKIHRSK